MIGISEWNALFRGCELAYRYLESASNKEQVSDCIVAGGIIDKLTKKSS